MAGLLSGLEKLGLGNLKNASLYEEKKAKTEDGGAKAAPTIQEQDFLFDKTYTCPVCDNEFKAKTVKIGRAKLKGTDMDLRPKYEHIDLLKYDVIACPTCGYAALSRYYKYMTSGQAKLIKQNISQNYNGKELKGDVISYDEALERYQLTLANAIVKQARNSEKAYICLKSAWLLRGYAESLDESAADYATKKAELEAQENEYLQNAFDGFLAARQSEPFPMCGMDEQTVDYLISVMAVRFEQYDVASKLISTIIASGSASPRMKDKARDLKELVIQKVKEKNSTPKK
ncbi:MAG: DUF2225 domain-containing protein [Lachnospiraceae bacterium]|nr:DUF2225 domain-containing protein [Lachnospiraceae bacterium]